MNAVSPTPAAASEATPTPMPEAKRKHSVGEKIFDWFTYSGVNGVGTFIATIALADILFHGKRANAYYHKALHGLERLTPSVAPWVHKKLLTTLILMQGGNVMLAPVTALEHYKVPIVNALNARFGDPTDPAQIEAVPRPDATNLVLGRLQAFAAILVSFMTLGFFFKDSIEKFENASGNLFRKITGAPEEITQTMHVFNKELGKIVEHEQVRVPSRAVRYGRLAAMDVIATAAASLLLYKGSHKLAEKSKLRKEGKLQTNTQAWFDAADPHAPSQPEQSSQTSQPNQPAATPTEAAPLNMVQQVQRSPERLQPPAQHEQTAGIAS